MNTSQTRTLFLTLLVVVAACGDSGQEADGGTTASGPSPGESAACAPLRTVHEIDTEMNEAMAEVVADLETTGEAAAFAELQAIVAETDPLLADVVTGYDEALAVAPDGLREDLSTLREGTVILWSSVIDLIITADSAEDFAASFEAALQDPEFLERTLATAAATLRLDEFTVPECGFRLSR